MPKVPVPATATPRQSAINDALATTAPPAPPVDPITEAAALEAVVNDELREVLDKLPEDRRAEVKAACIALRTLKMQEDAIEAAQSKAKKTWLDQMQFLETQYGVKTMPFLDPKTGTVMFSYRRQDQVLDVEPMDLRETLIEYFRVRKGEDDELAVVHTTDILERVLAEPKVNNDKFKALAAAGVIPDEVVTAVSRYVPRAAWVAFEKPKKGA